MTPIDALAAGDAAALFGAVEGVIDAGHDPRRFATDLLERFRDLIVLQAVPDAAARGVVDAPGDVLERMRDQAARLGAGTLTRYAEVVHAGLGEMRGATAPRLLLEVVCARLLLPSASDTESALLQRIERIETRLDMSIPADSATRFGASGPPAKPSKQFVRKTKAAAPPPEEPAPAPVPTPARAGTRCVRSRPRQKSGPPLRHRRPCSRPPTQWWRHPPHLPFPPPANPMPPRYAGSGPPCWTRCANAAARWRSCLPARSFAPSTAARCCSTTSRRRWRSDSTKQRNTEVVEEALKDALGVGLKVRYEVGSPST